MFSTTVEYALRAAVYLGTKYGEALTTEEVAIRTQVPAAYLAKILQGLTRHGLVRSQRGVGGGVTLGRPPQQMTLLDIIAAVEPFKRIPVCPIGHHEPGEPLCPLHDAIDKVAAAVEASFAGITLASLMQDGAKRVEPLCKCPSHLAETVVIRLPLKVAAKVV